MSVEDFTKAREARLPACPICTEVDCPGSKSLPACNRLWGNPDVYKVEYSPDGEEVLAVTFDRSMTELEMEGDDEPPEAA